MNYTIKNALITGCILLIWLYGGFAILTASFHQIDPTVIRGLTGLLGLIILFLGIRNGIKKAKVNSGESGISYLTCIKIGSIISLIVAFIVSMFGLLYMMVINPHFDSDMIAKAEESLKQAGLNADVLNAKMQNIKATFTIEGQVIQALIGQSVMGILFSCVLGFFFKKKNKKL